MPFLSLSIPLHHPALPRVPQTSPGLGLTQFLGHFVQVYSSSLSPVPVEKKSPSCDTPLSPTPSECPPDLAGRITTTLGELPPLDLLFWI
jgi:hypothetical protein